MITKETCFEEACAEHCLYQIACAGNYYLSDLSLIIFIPENIDNKKYREILSEYDFELNDWDDDFCCLVEFSNDGNLVKYGLVLEENESLKKSLDPNNCGFELYSFADEPTLAAYKENHLWLNKKLKENNLDENELYTISVDNLKNPTKIFIYLEDENKISKLIYTHYI